MELRKQADTRHVGESLTPGPKVSLHEGPFADQLLKLLKLFVARALPPAAPSIPFRGAGTALMPTHPPSPPIPIHNQSKKT